MKPKSYENYKEAYHNMDDAIKELTKRENCISMTHVIYRDSGWNDAAIDLGGQYPKNHNVQFSVIRIGDELYDLKINGNHKK